jgi:predicted RNA binding protein YcfA (HicA-like mRNA interferase family)
MPMKVREIITLLEGAGWYELPRRGTNHRQFKHPTKLGRVTVSGNPGHEVAAGTLRSIFKQAGIEEPRT